MSAAPTIADRVTKCVAETLGVEDRDVKPEQTFEELGGDSLDVVELALALEDEFLIEVPDQDRETLKTVQQAIDYVAGRISA